MLQHVAGGEFALDTVTTENYSSVGSLADATRLAADLEAGQIGVLMMSRLHTLDFVPQLARAVRSSKLVISTADLLSPLAREADLVLPASHTLESWGDAEPRRGLRSVIQPALPPLHDTRTEGDILLGIMGDPTDWQQRLFAAWKDLPPDWLDVGTILFDPPQTTPQASSVPPTGGPNPSNAQASAVLELGSPLGGAAQASEATSARRVGGSNNNNVTVVLAPSLRAFDGRSIPLSLTSEIPDPLSTVSYGAPVSIPQSMAAYDNARSSDASRITARLSTPHGDIVLRAVVQPALPDGCIVAPAHSGFALALPVLPVTGERLAVVDEVSLDITSAPSEPLPVLGASQTEAGKRGILPEPTHPHEHPADHSTLFPEHVHDRYRWAMVIDLDKCTGCSACVAACYVENNVPVAGPADHLRGREMSWLRIEPYVTDDGRFEHLPMLCQHCDHASCETVCPVYATYHNPEGLNAQVYNRCVGTRYCSNNCPYKVRRFNWWDHASRHAHALGSVTNPDVAVRPAGVMEKCTFCSQRIRAAKDTAAGEKRPVRDGEFTTACAQTCPTGAITFGSIDDPNSTVRRLAGDNRSFRVLEALGTRPAVYYLARRT